MSLLAPNRRRRVDQHRVDRATRSGLLRSVRLFRLFLAEQTDPEKFYASLAETVAPTWSSPRTCSSMSPIR